MYDVVGFWIGRVRGVSVEEREKSLFLDESEGKSLFLDENDAFC